MMYHLIGPFKSACRLLVIAVIVIALSGASLPAQAGTLTEADRDDVITNLAGELRDNYIFPDVADKLATLLEKKNREGDFREFSDGVEFTGVLTQVMREETNDLHFSTMYDEHFPDELLDLEEGEEGAPGGFDPRREEQLRRKNFGFEKIERLKGNVGYLDLRAFNGSPGALETAVAAMNYLANSDALIIDLRRNGGGSPAMIQLMLSYLYDGDPIHFNSFYNRPEDSHKQFWTLPYVPGRRLADADIFVLTSGFTGSAAEEFAYDIQTLERGTLVGRTTAGAAHPGGMFPLGHHIAAFIATGRAINPVTNTDWEGVGVKPDVDVPDEVALERAHALALKGLLEKSTDPAHRAELEWELSSMEAEANPVLLSGRELEKFAGEYGPRSIRQSGGGLRYQRGGGPELALIPITENSFFLGTDGEAKIEFTLADNGDVTGFTLLFKDGRRMGQPRTD